MADIRTVLEAMEPRMRAAFLDAVADIKSEAQIGLIVKALQEGRIADALRAVHLSESFFAPLDDAIRQAYIAGGRDALTGLPAIPDPFPRLGLWCALMLATRGPKPGSSHDPRSGSAR